MSIASQVTRIQGQRDTLRTNLIDLGVISDNAADLEDCVTAVGGIQNKGAIAGSIDGMVSSSYTVPAGFHSGSGTVSLTNSIENALAAI